MVYILINKKDVQIKALFYNYILSVLCAWKDYQNLMKLI